MSNILKRSDLISNANYEMVKAEAVALMKKPEHFDRETSWAMQIINDKAYTVNIAKQNPFSVLQSILKVCQCGLTLNPVLGHAYLVPYSGKNPLIAMQVGYKGWINLISRMGTVSNIDAAVIYDCDTFDHELGDNPWLKHKPAFMRPEDATIIGAYAIAFKKDGSKKIHVMRWSDIEKRRDKSPSWKAFKAGKANSCIWNDYPEEMAMKTPIRALSNVLRDEAPAIVYTQLSHALEADNQDSIIDITDGRVSRIITLLHNSLLGDDEKDEIVREAMSGEMTEARCNEIIRELKERAMNQVTEAGNLSPKVWSENYNRHVKER